MSGNDNNNDKYLVPVLSLPRWGEGKTTDSLWYLNIECISGSVVVDSRVEGISWTDRETLIVIVFWERNNKGIGIAVRDVHSGGFNSDWAVIWADVR